MGAIAAGKNAGKKTVKKEGKISGLISKMNTAKMKEFAVSKSESAEDERLREKQRSE